MCVCVCVCVCVCACVCVCVCVCVQLYTLLAVLKSLSLWLEDAVVQQARASSCVLVTPRAIFIPVTLITVKSLSLCRVASVECTVTTAGAKIGGLHAGRRSMLRHGPLANMQPAAVL